LIAAHAGQIALKSATSSDTGGEGIPYQANVILLTRVDVLNTFDDGTKELAAEAQKETNMSKMVMAYQDFEIVDIPKNTSFENAAVLDETISFAPFLVHGFQPRGGRASSHRPMPFRRHRDLG